MKTQAIITKPLFWIDLEMTGLNETVDHILEVAVVITDLELNTLDQYHRIVFQPPEILAGMNDWCKKTHRESGLTAKVPNGTSLATIESDLIALSNRHFPTREKIVLAGNSVYNDKRFIEKYLPNFAKRLHYRLIDVSSFKEIFREKYKVEFKKNNAHRAVDDVLESIRELKYYFSFIQVPSNTQTAPEAKNELHNSS